MPSGKSSCVLKEPLSSFIFILETIILKQKFYCKVENCLKIVMNIKYTFFYKQLNIFYVRLTLLRNVNFRLKGAKKLLTKEQVSLNYVINDAVSAFSVLDFTFSLFLLLCGTSSSAEIAI